MLMPKVNNRNKKLENDFSHLGLDEKLIQFNKVI